MNYCEYDEITGRILSVGSCPDSVGLNAFAHFPNPVLLGVSPLVRSESHYIEDGRAEPFPAKPHEHVTWDWTAHEWGDDLSGAKSAKSVAIDATCRNAILAGFESSSLGSAHHYPANMTDQQNLASSVLASLLPGLPTDWTTPFWCADVNGAWAFRLHSAAQIQQVGQDAKAAILMAMGKNEVLQGQISAASTLNDLEAIAW